MHSSCGLHHTRRTPTPSPPLQHLHAQLLRRRYEPVFIRPNPHIDESLALQLRPSLLKRSLNIYRPEAIRLSRLQVVEMSGDLPEISAH